MPYQTESVTKSIGRVPGGEDDSSVTTSTVDIEISLMGSEMETLYTHSKERLNRYDESLDRLIQASLGQGGPTHYDFERTMFEKLTWMYFFGFLENNGAKESIREKEFELVGELPYVIADILRTDFNRFGTNLAERYKSVTYEEGPTNEIGDVFVEYAQIATRVGDEPDFTVGLDDF